MMDMAFKPKMTKDERIRQWTLAKGAHKLKNRSSKDILKINHWPAHPTIYKSMSNAALSELARKNDFEADMELRRRQKKQAKKAAKKEAQANG